MIPSLNMISISQKILAQFGYSIKRRRPGIVRAGSLGEVAVSVTDLMNAVHGEDVYSGFRYEDYPEEIVGWGGDSAAFAELIREVRPNFIIEVGSWKGASAVTMDEVPQDLRRLGISELDAAHDRAEILEDRLDLDP